MTKLENKKSSLFKSFVFKGFGIAFIKSLATLKSGGFRLVIPCTQNFPEYDRKVTLPRVVIQTAVLYPHEYKFSLVFSVPVHIAMYGASRLFEGTITTREISQRIRKRKASDSVKRVGISVSVAYRVNSPKHIVFSFGPWMFYLPGSSFAQTILNLPRLLSGFVLTLLLYLRPTPPPLQHHHLHHHGPIRHAMPPKPLNGTQAEDNPPRKSLWTQILAYFCSKSPGLGYNFGWTHTDKVDSIGSTLLFEMQPFHPLSKELAYLSALLAGSKTSASPLMASTS